MVNPDAALRRYDGGKQEAKNALLAVFRVMNKGVAHVAQDMKDNPDHGRLIEIASRDADARPSNWRLFQRALHSREVANDPRDRRRRKDEKHFEVVPLRPPPRAKSKPMTKRPDGEKADSDLQGPGAAA